MIETFKSIHYLEYHWNHYFCFIENYIDAIVPKCVKSYKKYHKVKSGALNNKRGIGHKGEPLNLFKGICNIQVNNYCKIVLVVGMKKDANRTMNKILKNKT